LASARDPDPLQTGEDRRQFIAAFKRQMNLFNGDDLEIGLVLEMMAHGVRMLRVQTLKTPPTLNHPPSIRTLTSSANSMATSSFALNADHYFSEAAGRAVEQDEAGQPTGTTVYAAVEETRHHRTLADLEEKAELEPPPAEASPTEVMRHRLRTTEGPDPLQAEATDRGTRVWDHQERAQVPAIPPVGAGVVRSIDRRSRSCERPLTAASMRRVSARIFF